MMMLIVPALSEKQEAEQVAVIGEVVKCLTNEGAMQKVKEVML